MRALPAVLLMATFLTAGAACRRSATDSASDEGAASNSTSVQDEISAAPPFSTREPERYQAVRISSLTDSELLIARDGDKRREEYALGAGEKVVSLQLPAGVYLLYPSKKLYAEVKAGARSGGADAGKDQPADFSADKLLNQSAGGARYEKLGQEDVGGRGCVKYRVTITGRTNEAKNVTTESLIWIDESLGMPVKSETTVRGGAGDGLKYSTELRGIKPEVEGSLFELPTDYRKVEYEDMLRQIAAAAPGSAPKD